MLVRRPRSAECEQHPLAGRKNLWNLRVYAQNQVAYTRPVFPSASPDRATVLLVDDDPLLLDMFARFLRKAGLTVEVASNGRDAQAFFSEPRVSIDLLITDVDMPFVSGPELADFVAATGSSCPILLISGKWEAAEAAQKGWEFLAKPFLPSVLLETAQRLLARHRQPTRTLVA